MRGFAANALFLALAGPALGASVVNEDRTAYVVVVVTERATREITLRPGQTMRDLCERCEVSIEDIGVLTIGRGDRVIIRGNTMMVEDE